MSKKAVSALRSLAGEAKLARNKRVNVAEVTIQVETLVTLEVGKLLGHKLMQIGSLRQCRSRQAERRGSTHLELPPKLGAHSGIGDSLVEGDVDEVAELREVDD